MNRKEFTNLLLEWRKNFVNERTAPSLQRFVRKNFPIDVIFTNITLVDTVKSFKDFLRDKGKDPDKRENAVIKEAGEHPFIAINKSIDFKDALLSTENAFLTDGDRTKFEEAYRNSDPMILSAGFGGNNRAGDEYNQSLQTAQIFYWLLHDIVHDLFEDNGYFRWLEGNEGEKFNYNVNAIEKSLSDAAGGYNPNDFQYMTFSKEELDSGKLKEKPRDESIRSELVNWFVSIGFTPFVSSVDLQPSLFAYAISKLPLSHEEAKREISNIKNLSDSAKSVLVISHKVAFEAMNIFIDKFQNKILIACESQYKRK